MSHFLKTLVLALCLGALCGSAQGQSEGYYKTRQSGDWTGSSTWERFNGTAWQWPVPAPSAATSDGILIAAGHEITISSNVTADQLRVDGALTVNYGRTLTIADGPGTDLEQDHPESFIRIYGTLVNNGTIKINQGGFQIGTIVNNGDIMIGGSFQFTSGTITGNDIRYGPAGSLAIIPNYTVGQEDPLWPAEDGPANVSITNSVTLNGDRTVNGALDVTGALHVTGSLNSNGTAQVSGTLQLTGTFANNGTAEISGTAQINPGGNVTGNPFRYTGCCSKLEFRDSTTFIIGQDNRFWPETSGPETVSLPGVGINGNKVVLNAIRTIGRLDITYYSAFQVAGALTLNNGGNIGGILRVDGMFINNGETQIQECHVSGAFTNNGTLLIYKSFQLEEGGSASGNDFAYNSGGSLIFDNSSGPLNIDAGSGFWPAADGPGKIIVRGSGGISVNIARRAPGFFQLAAPVTHANNLTLAGAVEVDSGGSFDAPPTYSDNATLIYNTNDTVYAGPEWGGGINIGPGVPGNVEIYWGAVLVMPDSARRCPGYLYIRGTLVLSSTPGADLRVGGNWHNNGDVVSNSRQVILDGTDHQYFTGATTLDYLTIDNPAGISIPGHCEAGITDSVTVNRLLTLSAGNILLGECSGILTVLDSVSGGAVASHVVTYPEGWILGLVKPDEPFSFPVGPSEAAYNPVTVALDSSDAGEMLFQVRVDEGVLIDGIGPDSCVFATWSVIPECFPGALAFQWDALMEGPGFNRNAASIYLGDIEIPADGMASGPDPYVIRTKGQLPCSPNFLYQFVVGSSRTLTAVENLAPATFFLAQNDPNPFGASTSIRYAIPEAGRVLLIIYDVQGREIDRLVDERQAAGTYEARWNPAGSLADGVYFCRLTAGKLTAVRMLSLLR